MSAAKNRLPVLADLQRLPQRLEISCYRCPHKVTLTPDEAVAAFGADTTFVALRMKLVCAKCGAKGRDRQIDVRGSTEDYYAAIERERFAKNVALYGEEQASLMGRGSPSAHSFTIGKPRA